MQEPATTPRATANEPPRLGLSRQTVFRLGFGAMIALLLFVAFEAYRIQDSAARQSDEIYKKYARAGDRMFRIRRLIYLGSISVRDYYLSTAPNRREILRKEVSQYVSECSELVKEFEGIMESEGRLTELRARVQEFWTAVEAVTTAANVPRPDEAYELVQTEIVPRRTAAGVLLRELADANNVALEKAAAEFDASRRTALYRLFFMVGLCVVIGLAVAQLTLRRAEKSEKESLERFHQVAHARRDLQQLSARLLQIQEDERTRLSRELHDEIGQTLTALRIEISGALSAVRSGSASAERRLEEARALAEKTVATVRNTSILLRPSLLDDLGLEPALQWLVEDFSRRSGIRCTISSGGVEETISEAHRTCVYRVVQEALTNCSRHSAANVVEVSVRQSNGWLELTVADNGRGFEANSQGAPEGRLGLGILGMRERAAALGGEFKIDSAPGEGVRLSLRLPLPEAVPPASVETMRTRNS